MKKEKGGGRAGGGPLKLGDECISTRQNSSSTLYSSHLQDFNTCFLERLTFLVDTHKSKALKTVHNSFLFVIHFF